MENGENKDLNNNLNNNYDDYSYNNLYEDSATKKLNDLSTRSINNALSKHNFNNQANGSYKRPLISNPLRKGNHDSSKKGDNNDLRKKLMNHQRPGLGVAPKDKKKDLVNDPINANKSNSSLKNDVGTRNLKKSLSNKAKNLLMSKKKKNNKSSTDSKGNDSKNNDDNESSDKSDISLDAVRKIKRKILIIKIVFIGIGIFALFFFILLIAEIVTGGDALRAIPVVSPSTYETKDFESLTDDESDYHDAEIAYYKKLKELEKKYGDSVNINYVNSIVMQLYYEDDFECTDDKLLEETGCFDFAKMTKKAEEFAEIIKEIDSTDYAIGGKIFDSLKSNDKISDYYKDVLKTATLEEVLGRAFEIGEMLDEEEIIDDTVITEETKVTVVETKKEASSKTETKTVTKTLNVNEYIADSIYASTDSLQNSETIKAYTVVYSTNLASQNNKLSIDSSNATADNSLCSVKLGCSYDEAGNLVSGGGKQSSKNTLFYNGEYYYKQPLNSTEITNLNSSINSVFGNVLINSDGTYPTLDVGKINGLGDYKTILTNAYGDLKYKNIGEDSYILDGSYGNKKVQTKVIFYDQNDYGAYNFCGKKNETIKTSGCGTTSVAIILSTYENNPKYDPVAMMKEARKTGYCGGGITGTSPGFFKKAASTMKYKYYKASKYSKKDLNLVLQHLSQGDLVIVHIGAGHFTSGGHYMVLGGVDPETKKVYVYDPYNKVNKSYRKTGNGWYSFNDILVKEAWNFYIIWKG